MCYGMATIDPGQGDRAFCVLNRPVKVESVACFPIRSSGNPRAPVMEARSDPPEMAVPVSLGPRSYDIRIVTGLSHAFAPFVRSALARTWAGSACSSALLVTDSNVAKHAIASHYQDALRAAGIATTVVQVPAGEIAKSLTQAARLFDELVARRADRHTMIVALGGGVVGDVAGFVAATYARGLPLFMIPTTLLAQVDSSVGGKVGINHPDAKNIIGSFYQPIGVWIDTETLQTLPDRELRCGLAEVVKYGMILDEPFFASLERDCEKILTRDHEALRRIVIASCRMKAGIVTQDEREETGLRAILNFGHTIGHAIEAVAGYHGPFQHGEAVAVGMVAETRVAQRLGLVNQAVTERLAGLLERFGLPTSAPGLDCERLIAAMARDKKNQRGKIRFVLPRAIGQVELSDAAAIEDVRAVVSTLQERVPPSSAPRK
jgi:3-dehydroquinate synthase